MKTIEAVCHLCENAGLIGLSKFEIADSIYHLAFYTGDQNHNALFDKISESWNQEMASFHKSKRSCLHFMSLFISGDSEFNTLVYNENEYSSDWKWEFEITYNRLDELMKGHQMPDNSPLKIGPEMEPS